jgi:hypothetical protein
MMASRCRCGMAAAVECRARRCAARGATRWGRRDERCSGRCPAERERVAERGARSGEAVATEWVELELKRGAAAGRRCVWRIGTQLARSRGSGCGSRTAGDRRGSCTNFAAARVCAAEWLRVLGCQGRAWLGAGRRATRRGAARRELSKNEEGADAVEMARSGRDMRGCWLGGERARGRAARGAWGAEAGRVPETRRRRFAPQASSGRGSGTPPARAASPPAPAPPHPPRGRCSRCLSMRRRRWACHRGLAAFDC